jgi:hypothetical protein
MVTGHDESTTETNRLEALALLRDQFQISAMIYSLMRNKEQMLSGISPGGKGGVISRGSVAKGASGFISGGPGDYYPTLESAVFAWVAYYGPSVQHSDVEWASTIGRGVSEYGYVYYTFNEMQTQNNPIGVTPELLSISPSTRGRNLVQVAVIHNHPPATVVHGWRCYPNRLSPGDIYQARTNNGSVVALTPAGLLWYDSLRETTRRIPLSDVMQRIRSRSARFGLPGMTIPRLLQINDF